MQGRRGLTSISLQFAVGAIFLIMAIPGCGMVGMMAGGGTDNFMGEDSFTVQPPREDILDVVAQVGKSLGYKVSGLNKEMGTISLTSRTSMATGMLIGKQSNATLTVASKENGKKLGISIFLMGNFGTGGQEHAEKLMSEFKAKLSETLGQ